MKILLAAQHYPVASGRYMADTLKRMGHEVKTVGRAMGVEVWGKTLPERYRWTPDFDLTLDARGRALAFEPELVLVMDSDPEILNWADRLPYTLSPVVVYGVDNHVREYGRAGFDHYFLAHDMGSAAWHPLPEMWTWLPCATDDYLFPNSPVKWGSREYDVCCIGVLYDNRIEVLNRLQAAGLKVLAGTGDVYHEYRRAYQNSRIALVQSIRGDLPIRLFEGMGMGCAVLADYMPDLAKFDKDPVTVYRSADEAVALALELLALEPKVAQAGVDAASDWALRNHTWIHRAETILAWYNSRPSVS